MNKALFLDRDGIINEDSHYVHKPEQIVFCDGIFPLCKKALEKGYLLIIVTNQAGVAKGKFTVADVERLHTWMAAEFDKRGIPITQIYYCPYHPEGCIPEYTKVSDWRKPGPGMFLKAAKDHSIDLSQSIMVGDRKTDRIHIDGLRSIIVKSQYIAEGYDVEQLSDIIELL